MADLILDAIYENGVFRPLEPVTGGIAEGEKVRLRLLTVNAALRALDELAHIYNGLSEEEIKQIEKAILTRGNHSIPRQSEQQPEAR